MNANVLLLDKQFSSSMEEGLGKIGIRVVVFKKGKGKPNKTSEPSDEEVLDLDSGEDFSTGYAEVNSYLESPSRGKLCCVFVINGQRHHGLDNTFIVNDLHMKYLRKRMIIVVDLDGLTPKATSEIIQGSRAGLYEGKVYQRIHDRLVSTLKGDPDLQGLEEEAEEELSQLQVGDAAVQEALDQLIQEHFEGGDHSADGSGKTIGKRGLAVTNDGKKVQLDVVKPAAKGEAASYPVLLSSHTGPTYRLRPGEKGKLFISVLPEQDWHHVTDMLVLSEPTPPGYSYELDKKANHAVVDMQFIEPEGFDTDQYPIEVRLSVLATFKDQTDVRLTDKLVVIRPPSYAPPPQPPVLLDDPTFIRVTSRQPVRIIAGSAATHVRLRWDGKDELAVEPNAVWGFDGACISHPGMATLTFSRPTAGRFEALIHFSEEPLVGTKLHFELKAVGPHGKTLTASLDAEVVELPAPLDPRKLRAEIPAQGERRPPYKLVLVKEENFSSGTRWGSDTWDATHAGAFIDPKPDAPLTLCINQDLAILRSYLDSLVAKKADEKRTEERKTKYISHIAYHLYQMYLHKDKILKQKAAGSEVTEPRDDDMQEEVNRVAATLIRLMEVSR